MKAMILAAGRGDRMRPLTDNLPKPLLSVAGRPLISYHIERLVAAGVTDVVVNAAWLAEQLVDYLGDGSRFGARIQLSLEDEPLETAGGIRHALPLLGAAPFLVINGDVWTDYDFASLLAMDCSDRLAHLVMVPNPPHNTRGDFGIGEGGRLNLQASQRYTFGGISVMSAQLLRLVPDGPAPLAPLLRAEAASISAELYGGAWFDIGTPERLDQLESFLVAQHAPETSETPIRQESVQ